VSTRAADRRASVSMCVSRWGRGAEGCFRPAEGLLAPSIKEGKACRPAPLLLGEGGEVGLASELHGTLLRAQPRSCRRLAAVSLASERAVATGLGNKVGKRLPLPNVRKEVC